MFRKISSLFLIALIFNLNTVVPGVSYATAEETCSCHMSSADRQCHCEEGCNSCGVHKKEKSEVRSQESEAEHHLAIKGMTCATSPQSDGSALPAISIPFLLPGFENAIPTEQVSNLPNPIEITLYGVTITPSEKPPTA